MNDIKDQINELIKKINYHNIQYYVYDNPTISDYEYDILFKKLQNLELKFPDLASKNSPTKKRVGVTPLSKFSQVTHRIPMLSLSNAMNSNELKLFHTQMEKGLGEKIEYIGEPKLDGLGRVNLRKWNFCKWFY